MTDAADHLVRLIDAGLAEDVGAGDWTTLWTIPAEKVVTARVIAKAPGVIAGTIPALETFRRLDPAIEVSIRAPDGTSVPPGHVVLQLSGSARSILSGERLALNFLQRLSGVATLTRTFVDAIQGTSARILDTRKTTPGLRALEKAAVVAGGGMNHRFGLHDMILIKENHIRAAGGITAAVRSVAAHNHGRLSVEVEVTDLDELGEAIRAGVERVLLDNMSLDTMRAAVDLVRRTSDVIRVEASGGVSLATVRAIAETGVDFISVGALTHSAAALDLSLLVDDVD